MQEKIDQLRTLSVSPQALFIAGAWRQPISGAAMDVTSPIDGTKLTTIADAGTDDVDLAVKAARHSFEKGSWSKAAPAERKKVLLKIAELIEKNALELAVLGVRDNGTEISMALKAEPGSAAGTFRYYAEAVDKVYGQIAPTAQNILGLVHREAIGVVAAIVPWNFPMMIGAWKIAPALAAGNSVVLKPAEGASLTLLKLAEICAEAGLPEGVLNVVTGRGAVCGEALGLHMDIDVLAFTGSGPVGRRLLEYSARSNLKRVYLELGGKSPNIVFADAPDLDQAAKVSAYGIFRNSGQVCVAGSRLLVEKSIHKAFSEKVTGIAESMKVGDPLQLSTEAGAISSEVQLRKDLGYVSQAVSEGASLRTGGSRILEETGGYYMRPTVFDATPSMTLAREEVFGPILSIIPFETEAEALEIANATEYGLASAVWTSNMSCAHRMVRGIRAGVVHVNTYGGSDNSVPLGGVKQSGNGHDKSLHALDKYVDLKTAWIQL
ncbi:MULTISPECIES: aldehyde dehydrogenase [Rhizobium]|uniref:Aldehyde dehydrogenase n=1 Tax=Rhizobium tropici TaxID=398 RepID=A0A6P1C0M9_RHITR|nr:MULTISPECIES: aldehyde dehydrogenase [Rhizobium]AGB74580.1 gamma-glutamyl-gamma-aminobutyraldehyde dehydrogenase [Rhizobium tropici CIAT 899]MBB4242680.1 gamma-glutamyl-gamma-aminobutyraldehyde dehydrogenase [Rhizobium tropici]MBB5594415.1 gamma-glutamyl-gamma-aminobutyraldehyde dehydrogenase [Rhizobium tropici]MBB6493005.1 gamma-glutamyl-gamma-aminobutyraldehyde dehydrogenase [Rhizobium tropici]NEV10669.1 aldehyde dehydrogenase [Rhizobium tropici]